MTPAYLGPDPDDDGWVKTVFKTMAVCIGCAVAIALIFGG